MRSENPLMLILISSPCCFNGSDLQTSTTVWLFNCFAAIHIYIHQTSVFYVNDVMWSLSDYFHLCIFGPETCLLSQFSSDAWPLPWLLSSERETKHGVVQSNLRSLILLGNRRMGILLHEPPNWLTLVFSDTKV